MASSTLLLDVTRLDGDRFQVAGLDAEGAALARAEFEWRTETAGFEEDLKRLEALAHDAKLRDSTFHVEFGKKLYRALLGGDVGDAFRKRLATEPAVPLILRVDPRSAQPLSRLPWELLHDESEFLALNPRTPIARLPWGVAPRVLPPIAGGLRLLVVVSNPDDLPENLRLDVEAEREIILIATDKLQREGRLEVVFLEDASLESIQDALTDSPFHLLHVTGHGGFDPQTQQGVLLLEDEQGHQVSAPGEEFVKAVRGSGLRFILLSACRTATPAHHAAYRDVVSQLAAAGFPLSLAMQYSVEDRAATGFAEKLYRALCSGQDVHTALARARAALLTERTGPAAHVTPVAYVADPNCLQVDRTVPAPERRALGPVDFGLVPKMERGFVGRWRELRRLRRRFAERRWTAAVIHGIGGIGKSALASRLALRMVETGIVDGVKVINCTPALTADGVLAEMNAFLNLAGDARLNDVIHQPLPLQSKTAVLAQALEARPFLVVFDNVEDCLKQGSVVSRAAQVTGVAEAIEEGNGRVFRDAQLEQTVAQLVGSVAHQSLFLFTSRVDFDPVEPGRMGEATGRVGLGELGFVAAAQLMNRREALAALPVVADEGALSKRRLFEQLGGHPWALDQFARRAERLGAQEALRGIAGLRGELLAFTLVEKAIAELSERAALLLHCAAIYDEPTPLEGLAFMLGDEQDAMPGVDDEVASLLGWGLLTRVPGTDDYVVHTLVRDWARDPLRMSGEERLALLRRAAGYWLGMGRDSTSLQPELNAHHYLFEAGDYEQAGDIVNTATEYLLRWGQIELLLRLLTGSVRTLSGGRKAVALGNLATVYQGLGDYTAARRIYEQVLAEFETLGARPQRAAVLYQLGILHQAQGEYDRARQRYEQSLAIAEELGDRAGVARSLHQLGILHQDQGEYEGARQRYEQSLVIFQELGDRAGVARSLHDLGALHQDQGEYERARQRYEQSLAIKEELGDRAGVALSLAQMGLLFEQEGHLDQAVGVLARALALFDQLGAPQREQARRDLARLRDKMGEEAFEKALHQAGVSAASGGGSALRRAAASLFKAAGQHLGGLRRRGDPSAALRAGVAQPGMTAEQFMQVLVNNTVAVLTRAPDNKREWWEALGQLQVQARQAGPTELAAFVGVLQRLVEGALPETLTPGVPAEFGQAWQQILNGIATGGG